MIRLLEGDSLDILRATPEGTYTFVVTDPPYGLSAPPDPLEVMRQWLADGDYHKKTRGKGKGFMGAEWDHFVPGPILWREVFRTCKPGAVVLCFAATRTMDWMSLSLRCAGFEILDTIAWLQAQGMAKAGTIDKKIDARNGDERPVVGTAADFARDGCKRDAATHGSDGTFADGGLGSKWDTPVTAPASAESAAWAGWSTQLAPGYEPIIVARRPCEGTATANILRHGCGAMNIDACRIACTDKAKFPAGVVSETEQVYGGGEGMYGNRPRPTDSNPEGRWPKNVLLDPTAAAVLDATNPHSRDGVAVKRNTPIGKVTGFVMPRGNTGIDAGYGGGGGVSRFFWVGPLATADDLAFPGRYVPKARKTDRDGGVPTSMPEAPRQFSGGHEGNVSIPLHGSPVPVARNPHPTVKPQALMEYLLRLVGHPKGRGLDPFAGSGSTLRAARTLGLSMDGIERDPAFAEIARHRSGVHSDASMHLEVGPVAEPEVFEWDSALEREPCFV